MWHLAVLAAVLAGCGPSITAQRLESDLRQGNTAWILDARSAAEYARDHVPTAHNTPFTDVVAHAERLAVPKDAPIVLYCEHGPRAYLARWSLHRAGWAHVTLLEGHMTHWRSSGHPTATGVATGDAGTTSAPAPAPGTTAAPEPQR